MHDVPPFAIYRRVLSPPPQSYTRKFSRKAIGLRRAEEDKDDLMPLASGEKKARWAFPHGALFRLQNPASRQFDSVNCT
jgi:hypothetical protein